MSVKRYEWKGHGMSFANHGIYVLLSDYTHLEAERERLADRHNGLMRSYEGLKLDNEGLVAERERLMAKLDADGQNLAIGVLVETNLVAQRELATLRTKAERLAEAVEAFLRDGLGDKAHVSPAAKFNIQLLHSEFNAFRSTTPQSNEGVK